MNYINEEVVLYFIIETKANTDFEYVRVEVLPLL